MSSHDPQLEDPGRAGVYFVSAHELDVLAAFAFEARLLVRRIDLMGGGVRRARATRRHSPR
jgi:hypothetical protein